MGTDRGGRDGIETDWEVGGEIENNRLVTKRTAADGDNEKDL